VRAAFLHYEARHKARHGVATPISAVPDREESPP